MNTLSKCLSALLIGTAFLSSCSRPVAYFQPTAREQFTTASVQAPPVITAETPASVAAETPSSAVTNTPAEQVAQATVALDQMDALVRSDSKIAADKTVQKRLHRVRNLLAAASAKTALSTGTTTSKKMNLMERLMMKKMNKKINRQLAPANPEKTMISTGTLAVGAVLVILGLLLLLLTTGTGATVGLIALLVGAVVLLVGLL